MASLPRRLLEELQQLRTKFEHLAQVLDGAAGQLRCPGVLPDSAIESQLAEIRRDFASLVSDVNSLASTEGSDTCKSLASVPSLQAIEDCLQQIDQRRSTNIVSRAREHLSELLRLRHIDGRLGTEIEAVHNEARELLNVTDSGHAGDALPIADDIVSGSHPVSALLKLVKDYASLDEEKQVPLVDLVKDRFGTRVMLASVQGQLVVTPDTLIASKGGCERVAEKCPALTRAEGNFSITRRIGLFLNRDFVFSIGHEQDA
jgi:hypothetical protein